MSLPKTLGAAPAPAPAEVAAPPFLVTFACSNYPALSFSHPKGLSCPGDQPSQFHRGLFKCTTPEMAAWMEECIAGMAPASRGLIQKLDMAAAEEVARRHQAATAGIGGGAVRGPITSAMIERMKQPVTAAQIQQDAHYAGANRTDVNKMLESLGQPGVIG